jgi:hypothetical protein
MNEELNAQVWENSPLQGNVFLVHLAISLLSDENGIFDMCQIPKALQLTRLSFECFVSCLHELTQYGLFEPYKSAPENTTWKVYVTKGD